MSKSADNAKSKTLKEITKISNKLGNRKVNRPQSPRNPYRGRKYIPPLVIPCNSILDAVTKLKKDGYVVANTTTNFFQHRDGQTAVIQILRNPDTKKDEVSLYIRGNQPNQI